MFRQESHKWLLIALSKEKQRRNTRTHVVEFVPSVALLLNDENLRSWKARQLMENVTIECKRIPNHLGEGRKIPTSTLS